MVPRQNSPAAPSPHDLAVRIFSEWAQEGTRIDALVERATRSADALTRSRTRSLVFGAVRHWRRVGEALAPFYKQEPKPLASALLHIAGGEIVDNPEAAIPAVVDCAVNWAKKRLTQSESGFVNAVLRRAAPVMRPTQSPAETPAALGRHFSHPDWLVQRWLGAFGAESTQKLLTWNQTAADVFVRIRPNKTAPDWLEATQWPGFFRIPSGRWDDVELLIRAGTAYVQDPATRLCVEAAAPKRGERVLEFCAAPGGKTLQLVDALEAGSIVAVDLPGPRLARFEENLGHQIPANSPVRIDILASDVLEVTAESIASKKFPTAYDIVLLDAPCTNTGVLRHRIDAKWRLTVADIHRQSAVQSRMLRHAAQFVAPGGRLVYSTCSIEAEENDIVVKVILRELADFHLVSGTIHTPQETNHDGAGVFLLQKKT